ncbi:hypothetical protein ACIQM0_23835 [Streptomyces sp. NPDC091387]|uniref:hypothetical protein n=1 Tax=Streptomyces sp. NPDC091387 TaxID=3365998 RepID=UPI0037FE2DFA
MPSPPVSHHTPCSASVYAGPPWATAAPTIVPETPTPMVVPVCRAAEVSEVATPAIERGRLAAGDADQLWAPHRLAGR